MHSFSLLLILLLLFTLTQGYLIQSPASQAALVLKTKAIYQQHRLFTSQLPTKFTNPHTLFVHHTTHETPLTEPIVTLPKHYLKFGNRVVTYWGLLYALIIFGSAGAIFPFMLVVALLSDLFGDSKNRRWVDWVIFLWARISIFLSRTKIKADLSHLPSHQEAVIYIPNHTSFLDILILSGSIPRRLKYLSKIEVSKIPVIGWAMILAKHIFLKRNNIQSTFRCNQECLDHLKNGNSIVFFAEGTRSMDGRLHNLRKGAFQIAKTANVRIVPVSIANLFNVMPPKYLLPISPIKDIFIKIHPPIDTHNKTINELKQLCFQAMNSGLPTYQQYSKLPEDPLPILEDSK